MLKWVLPLAILTGCTDQDLTVNVVPINCGNPQEHDSVCKSLCGAVASDAAKVMSALEDNDCSTAHVSLFAMAEHHGAAYVCGCFVGPDCPSTVEREFDPSSQEVIKNDCTPPPNCETVAGGVEDALARFDEAQCLRD